MRALPFIIAQGSDCYRMKAFSNIDESFVPVKLEFETYFLPLSNIQPQRQHDHFHDGPNKNSEEDDPTLLKCYVLAAVI